MVVSDSLATSHLWLVASESDTLDAWYWYREAFLVPGMEPGSRISIMNTSNYYTFEAVSIFLGCLNFLGCLHFG